MGTLGGPSMTPKPFDARAQRATEALIADLVKAAPSTEQVIALARLAHAAADLLGLDPGEPFDGNYPETTAFLDACAIPSWARSYS